MEAYFTDSVLPSMIGFDHHEFKNMIKEEMQHHGYDSETLGKMLYMRDNRMQSLLSGQRAEFTYAEFKEINRLFNFY